MGRLVFGRYDYAICLCFAAYAMCSTVVPMVLIPMGESLAFPLTEGGMGMGGALQLARSIPMVATMLVCGFLSGWLGKRATLGLSILFMSAGIAWCGLAGSYEIVFLAVMVAGLGEGVVEGLATPFVQDLHPDQPGRYLNFSHSFWSVGVVAVVLAAGALMYWGVSWRWIVGVTGLAGLIPALMMVWPDRKGVYHSVNEKFHWREIVSNSVVILKKRRFWVFFAAMFFAGGGEYCLTFWCATFIRLDYGGTAWAAGAGTALFAAGMIIGRMGSGYLVHQDGLKRLCVICAVVAVAISLWFPFLTGLWGLFALLFLVGIVTGPFWPSIQSYASTRMTVDNTMLFVLLSCAGVPGCGVFATVMGVFGDWWGLRTSFLLVPGCFALIALLIGCDRWLMGKDPGASAAMDA